MVEFQFHSTEWLYQTGLQEKRDSGGNNVPDRCWQTIGGHESERVANDFSAAISELVPWRIPEQRDRIPFELGQCQSEISIPGRRNRRRRIAPIFACAKKISVKRKPHVRASRALAERSCGAVLEILFNACGIPHRVPSSCKLELER